MWVPIKKILTTISICILLGAGVPSGAGNPADQVYDGYGGHPSATSTNYYKDKFEGIKQELEALKKKHAKHEPPPYKLGKEYKPTYGQTVKRIRDRGYMICGSYNDKPGFSQSFGTSHWEGFDVDICTAIAIAIMGEDWSMKTIEVDGKTRFEYLFDGTVDVISATTTWTYSRDVEWRIEFLPTTYYDGQGFIVRKSLGVKSAKDLTGARVCYSENSTAAQNIKDFFELWDVDFKPVPLRVSESAPDAYIDGECDMFGSDRSALAGKKSIFSNPNSHVILPEVISKEPLSPAVKYGDQQFSDIARWAIYVLFLAEEYGITEINIDDFTNHKDPLIQMFMGEQGNLGEKLGIKNTFAFDIISIIGNYGEIFEMYLGKETRLGLDRGLNRLYNKGGLLYAPPLK